MTRYRLTKVLSVLAVLALILSSCAPPPRTIVTPAVDATAMSMPPESGNSPVASATQTPLPTMGPTDTALLPPAAKATAALTPSPTAGRAPGLRPNALATLLAFFPPDLADQHADTPLGPALHFVDVARMRHDLDLPPVSGTSPRQDKIKLITALNTQRLSIGFDVFSSSMFDEWGFDIADVDQALTSDHYSVAILTGEFGRPEIRAALIKKGYIERESGLFRIYTGDKGVAYAVKPDMIIRAPDEWTLSDVLDRSAQGAENVGDHRAVAALLSHLQGASGALLAPPGKSYSPADWQAFLSTLPAEARQTLIERYHLDRGHEFGWDFCAIGYWVQGAKGQPCSGFSITTRRPLKQGAISSAREQGSP